MVEDGLEGKGWRKELVEGRAGERTGKALRGGGGEGRRGEGRRGADDWLGIIDMAQSTMKTDGRGLKTGNLRKFKSEKENLTI